jgi:uncharacterized membrane protein
MVWIISFLSLAGLLNALYFAMSYYGLTRGQGISGIEGEGRCLTVMQAPEARVLGPPNFIPGIAYYLALIALSWTAGPASGWRTAAWVASWLTVLMGLYLVHALRFRLRVSCPLCMLGHGINLALAVCLTIWWV